MATAREVLIATLEDVTDTEVPSDLRAIAFSKVFDLRAGTHAGASAPAPTTSAGGVTSGPAGAGAAGDALDDDRRTC